MVCLNVALCSALLPLAPTSPHHRRQLLHLLSLQGLLYQRLLLLLWCHAPPPEAAHQQLRHPEKCVVFDMHAAQGQGNTTDME